MANIGGRVLYDSARTAISGTGIANVPDAIAALTADPGVSIAQIIAMQMDIGDTLQSAQLLESILSQRFRNLEY